MDAERIETLRRFLERFELPADENALALIDVALTHRSFSFERQLSYDNERLEFLGDAVVGLLAAEHLYRRYENAREGELSKRKGRVVSRTALGRQARAMGLDAVVCVGRGEERTGGRHRPVLIGSALEALVGAVYVAMGWDVASRFVRRHIIEPLDAIAGAEDLTDHKSLLQELVQKRFQTTPEYRLIRESGPEHQKRFFVEVFVRGEKWGEGTGPRKKAAENDAARAALEFFQQTMEPEIPEQAAE
ncbi:MAG: ribonuclease III [Candidatus Sumerlaeia bacterium]|nr:ribonuclease III [Candidatus Sumerlaeia bacterium]